MKNFIRKFLPIIVLACLFSACKHDKTPTEEIAFSFNPEDTASVHRLFQFYIDNDIVLPEMLRCAEVHPNDTLHSYDCLIDGCEIAHDFLDDSLRLFFTELNCMSGSCGNDIYLIERDGQNFKVRLNTCGTIDQELGVDTTINGCKVLYFQQETSYLRIVFDGKEFQIMSHE